VRFLILLFLTVFQCFLQAGDDFCKLEYTKEDLSDLTVRIDRSKILTSGRDGTSTLPRAPWGHTHALFFWGFLC
jgi:hypothetical protein